MRNSTGRLGLAMAALLAAPMLTAAQDGAPKGNLVQQLQKAYPLTVMDKKGKVTQAGTTLVVKKEGIQANPRLYYPNDYENGQVTASAMGTATDQASSVLDQLPGGVGSVLRRKAKVDSRVLAVAEKVYLLRMDIGPASIDFLSGRAAMHASRTPQIPHSPTPIWRRFRSTLVRDIRTALSARCRQLSARYSLCATMRAPAPARTRRRPRPKRPSPQ
jgi:hypothetical protein